MKRKLSLLFTLFTFCVSVAWADDVTVTISQHPDTNGKFTTNATLSDYYTTWTSDASSGLADLVITTGGNLGMCYMYVSSGGYQHLLALKTTSNKIAETLTVNAPTGYYIKGYSMTARLYSSSQDSYSVTNCAGTETTFGASAQTISETNLCSNTFTLKIKDLKGSSSNYFCVTAFTVTLAPIPTYDVNYTELSINNTTGPTVAKWGKSWTSTSNPAGLQLTCTANNMAIDEIANLHSAGGQTYTLTAPDGYFITGYTIGMYGGLAGSFITPFGYGATSVGTDSSNPTYVYVTGLSTKSTTFTRTGTSTDGYATTFKVYLKPTYNVTYKLPGTSQTDVVVEQLSGSSVSAPSAWERDGVTFSYYTSYSDGVFSSPIATTPAGAQTVYVDYNYSLSSLLSESTSSLKWYRLYCSGNSGNDYDLFNNGSAPYPFVIQSDFNGADGYFWAFVGNPFDGFKIYNKNVTTNTLIYNNATNPAMGTDDGTKWYITTSGDKIGFRYTGNTEKCLNDYGGNAGTLKYYSSESWFSYTGYNDIDYSDLVTANIQPYITNYGEGYFRITEGHASALTAAINSATESGGNISPSEYTDLFNALNSCIKKPTAGYYRIKSKGLRDSGTPTYIACTNGQSLITTATSNEASSIVKLSGTYPNFRLSIEGKNVQKFEYVYDALAKVSDADGSLHTFEIVEPGYATILNYAPLYFYESDSHTVTAQSISGGYTSWALEPVTSLSISLNSDDTGNYFATLCLPYDVTITGADAFTLTKSGNYLVPTEVTNNKVPAGTPVLLRGTNASALATINNGEAFNSGTPLSCALTGTYVDMTVEKTDGLSNDYYLGIKDSKVGFYKWNGTTLKANRAYFEAAKASQVKEILLNFDEDDVTGIASPIEKMGERGTIFNMAGQRVNKTQKGIYIINGKKILL